MKMKNIFAVVFLALGLSQGQLAEARAKKASAPFVSETIAMTAKGAESQGCYVQYTRRHEKGDYNKNVAFNFECCDNTPGQKCCGNKGGADSYGSAKGCEPLLGARKKWFNAAELQAASKKACDLGNFCMATGAAAAVGGGMVAFGGGSTILAGNVMGGGACVLAGGAVALKGVNAVTQRQAEIRECMKLSPESFKPGVALSLESANIPQMAKDARYILLSAITKKEAGTPAESLAHGAQNMADDTRQIYIQNEIKAAGELLEDSKKSGR